jgi:hypothetical protein
MTEPSQTAPMSAELCAMCSNPATSVCNICRCIRYGSKACQKDDWSVHKLLCKTFKDFNEASAPKDYYRAVFFPEDGNKPRFIWLKMMRLTSKATSTFSVHFEGLPIRVTVEPLELLDQCDRNAVLDRAHERISLIARTAPNANGVPRLTGQPNVSVGNIEKEIGEAYRGPLIYHGMGTHLDMMSFRHIVDWI